MNTLALLLLAFQLPPKSIAETGIECAASTTPKCGGFAAIVLPVAQSDTLLVVENLSSRSIPRRHPGIGYHHGLSETPVDPAPWQHAAQCDGVGGCRGRANDYGDDRRV